VSGSFPRTSQATLLESILSRTGERSILLEFRPHEIQLRYLLALGVSWWARMRFVDDENQLPASTSYRLCHIPPFTTRYWGRGRNPYALDSVGFYNHNANLEARLTSKVEFRSPFI
jgi:hypothetical protein